MRLNDFLTRYTEELRPFFKEYNKRVYLANQSVSGISVLWGGPFKAASIIYISEESSYGELSQDSIIKLQQLTKKILEDYKPELIKYIAEIEEKLRAAEVIPLELISSILTDLRQIESLLRDSKDWESLDAYLTKLGIESNTSKFIQSKYYNDPSILKNMTTEELISQANNIFKEMIEILSIPVKERDSNLSEKLVLNLLTIINILSSRNIKEIFNNKDIKITEVQLWSLGFKVDNLYKLSKALKEHEMIAESTELLIMSSREHALQSIPSTEVFDILSTSPLKLLAKRKSNNIPFYGYGVNAEAEEMTFSHKSYGEHLSECHCIPGFARGSKSFRIIAEDSLIQAAKTFSGKRFKLAIIGSGTLFQVVVILTKLAKFLKFDEIDLDLVDPLMFNERNRSGFRKVANDFQNLLCNMGFNLCFGYTDSTFLDTPSRYSEKTKGKVNIKFHDKYYQAADIIFINDCPISKADCKPFLDTAKPNAIFIAAVKRQGYSNSILFEIAKKGADSSWKTIITTSNLEEIPPISSMFESINDKPVYTFKTL